MLVLVVRRFLLVLAFAAGSSCCLSAQGTLPMPVGRGQEDTKSADVRELVSKYCRLDYEGARLDGKDWAKVEPLVSWKSNPEYAEINVIARYTVDPEPTSSHEKFTVTVRYRLLGSYNLVTGYAPEGPGAVQNMEFTVTDTNGNLRISDSENNLPHPSRATMLKWLNEKLNAAQDETSKQRYQDALQKLQAQPASPFAK